MPPASEETASTKKSRRDSTVDGSSEKNDATPSKKRSKVGGSKGGAGSKKESTRSVSDESETTGMITEDTAKIDSKENTKAKAYYPKNILFDASKTAREILEFAPKNATPRDLLEMLIKEVCASEAASLKEYFSGQSGREDLFRSLQTVLEKLPSEVLKECPANAIFKREGSQAILATDQGVSDMKRQQTQLQKHLAALRKYSLEIESLERELEASVETDDGATAHSLETTETRFISKRYSEKLTNIETHCDRIAQETSEMSVSKIKDMANSSQQQLYNIYQKIRFEAIPGSSSAPRRPQDLIRGMQ